MIPDHDIERLQEYLDGTLSAAEVSGIESRLKTETPLAQALLALAQEEAVLLEWSSAQAGIRNFSGFCGTSQSTMGSNMQGPSAPDRPGAPRPQEARIMLMQANCPGCRSTLKIPAGWMHQPIRCKHCGMVIQLQQKAAVPPPAIPVGRAPSAIPVGQAPPPAAIMAGGQSPPPAAIRMPAAPAGTYNAAQRTRPRAATTPRQKMGFVAVWVVGLAVMAGAVFAVTQLTGDNLGDNENQVAQGDPEDEPITSPDEPRPGKSGPKPTPIEKTMGDPAPTKSNVTAPKPVGETPKEKTKRPDRPLVRPVEIRPPMMKNPPDTGNTTPTPTPRPITPRPNTRPIDTPPQQFGGSFPRRLLSINPNNYLYFNPVNYGPKLRDTHELVLRMSRALNIPPTQVVELSDAAPGAVPPMKQIVEKTLTDFCTTSRAQDRIILVYSGHIVEIDDEIYLVPIEGEMGDKESLITLKSVFEQLSKSKARQKVLIMDLCRFNPSRGAERPDSGKMGEKLDAALKEPPAGVQVWSACVAGQNSCEDGNIINGGIFFNALMDALGTDPRRQVRLPNQTPRDGFPLDVLSEKVNKWVEQDADLYVKQKQTPRLSGEEITEGAAPYNASEAAAERVKLDWSTSANIVGVASKAMIEGILKETSDIPPVKILPEGVQPIRAETFPLFAASILKDYKAEEANTEFREAVVKATEVLKRHAKSLQEDFRSNNIDQLKMAIPPVQKGLATTKLELEEALEAMTGVAEKREEEKNKRWQANYDYVLARLKMRTAYVFEYQYMLSEIRTDSLPERPEGSPGWRLASGVKLQCKGPEGKEAKKNFEDAKKLLQKLTEEHKGTPWEILAKRETFTNLGLEWQPIGGGKAEEKAEKK